MHETHAPMHLSAIPAAGKPILSHDELTLLLGTANGLPIHEIAQILDPFNPPRRQRTDYLLRNLRERMGATSRPHMVALAYEWGIIEPASAGRQA